MVVTSTVLVKFKVHKKLLKAIEIVQKAVESSLRA